MTLNCNKNKYYFLFFWAIIIFNLANNYFWLKQSTDIKGTDVPNHLFSQLKFHHILSFIISNPNIPFFIKIKQFIHLMNTPMDLPDCAYWPNFVFFSSTLFSLIFGNALFIVKLTMLTYLLILLSSVYAVAKTIGDRQTGIIAMCLVSMYPLIFESSRQYGLDFPLAAIVVLSIWLLLKTNYFTNSYYSILLGISAGIGMLIKGQFILFFTWPLLIIFCKYFFRKNKIKFSKKILLNIILFFSILALVSSIWWLDKLKIVVKEFIVHISSHQKYLEGKTTEEMYSLDFYLYHLKTLIFNSIGIIFSILFLISIFSFIKAKVKYKGLLISWIFIPFLLFSILFVVKQSRFLMSILPAIAIVSAWGAQQISQKRVKKAIIFSLIILLGLLQYYILSFSKQYNYNYRIKKMFTILGSSTYGTSPHYDFEKLKLTKEAVEAINKGCINYNSCKIGTVIVSGHMSTLEILYWLYYWNPNLYVLDWLEMYHDFFKELPNLPYLIFVSYKKDGFTWPKGQDFLELASKYYTKIQQSQIIYSGWNDNFNKLSAFESKFYLLKTIEFSNGLCWYIYKKS